MCKENMTDAKNSRVWERWSRARSKNSEWLNSFLKHMVCVGEMQSLLSCLWTLYHIILLHPVHCRLFTSHFNLSPLMPHWNFCDALPLLLWHPDSVPGFSLTFPILILSQYSVPWFQSGVGRSDKAWGGGGYGGTLCGRRPWTDIRW